MSEGYLGGGEGVIWLWKSRLLVCQVSGNIGLWEVFLSHRMGKGTAGMGSVCGYVYGEWNYIMSGLGHWHSCNTL